jgi:hypothetical protein
MKTEQANALISGLMFVARIQKGGILFTPQYIA